MTPTQPLHLSTPVRTYPYGGRRLAEVLGKRDLPDGVIAETWEVSGFDVEDATVKGGAYSGWPLSQLTRALPDELVWRGWHGEHFPLLVKLLDASHPLEVHLHPDDEAARALYGQPRGKVEAWHVLWAQPGVSAWCGLREGVMRDLLRSAVHRGDAQDLLVRREVRVGDTVYVPAGVPHTFGPGLIVLEVQQASDLGVNADPADPEQAERFGTLARLDARPKPHAARPLPGASAGNDLRLRCAGPHFRLERWTLRSPLPDPSALSEPPS